MHATCMSLMGSETVMYGWQHASLLHLSVTLVHLWRCVCFVVHLFIQHCGKVRN